jgi:hypothetical protein
LPAIDGLGGFGEFVGLALVVLGGVCRRLAGLIRGRRPALGQRCANADHQGQPGKNEVAQHRKPTLKHPLTHKIPELVLAQVLSDTVPPATLAAK